MEWIDDYQLGKCRVSPLTRFIHEGIIPRQAIGRMTMSWQECALQHWEELANILDIMIL